MRPCKPLTILSLFLCALTLSIPVLAFDIYLVRHFEKQTDSLDPALTPTGQARAMSLATTMESIQLNRVLSTDYQRTQQTAAPVARAKGVAVESYDPAKLAQLAQQLVSAKQPVLVVGHSNTTPQLIQLLGAKAPTIGEKDYGELFVVSFGSGKPQLSSKLIVVSNDH